MNHKEWEHTKALFPHGTSLPFCLLVNNRRWLTSVPISASTDTSPAPNPVILLPAPLAEDEPVRGPVGRVLQVPVRVVGVDADVGQQAAVAVVHISVVPEMNQI